MIVLALVVGALLGAAALQSVGGAVVGGVIGFLVAQIVELKTRVRALEQAAPREAPGKSETQITTPGPKAAPPPPQSAAEPDIATSRAATPPQPTAAAPHAPPPPPPPPEPSILDDVVQAVQRFFTEGNTLARIGIIVLFFGIAFLLKYAAEHSRLPIELRLAGVAIGAIGLLFAGARLRRKREGYGLTLEGGAIGVLSLTIFAAFRLYGLLPASLAFALLVATFAACVVLAVTQNSIALAALGVAGAFLAPLLASTGQGSHVALFSYYALVNGVILAIAWFKAWRLLNLIGFGFTFVVGAAWGYRYYRPEFVATTEPFLILFFLFYVAVAILFARRQPPELRRPVDGTLVFGVPIVGFLLQAALVKDYEYGLAWSAFALGAVYLGLAGFVLSRGYSRLLAEAFLALGVIFTTLTIPLAVDGHWTAAAWAIEGAGILWVGLRQRHLLAQVFGLLIQFGAGVFFFQEARMPGEIAVLNSAFMGTVLLASAGVISAHLLQRHRAEAARLRADLLAYALLAWGLLWWYGGALNEIDRHVAGSYRVFAWLTLIVATTLAQDYTARRIAWPGFRYAALFNLVWLYLALALALDLLRHPFAAFGLAAWSFAIGVYYMALRQARDAPPAVQTAAHTGTFWLAAIVLGWELQWQTSQFLPRSDWADAISAVFLAVLLALPLAYQTRFWPLKEHGRAYVLIGAVPVVLLSLLWVWTYGTFQPGNPAPLPYVPLLNPLDVATMFVLLALFYWAYRTRALTTVSLEAIVAVLGVSAFGWLNAALFRALHHYAGLRYTLTAIYDSTLAQAAVAIFWTVLAFALMLVAKSLRQRRLWLVGAALLGVVVVKLFLVDLSGTGTIERIVSFVGVGLLLLVIGYLVPVPPRTVEPREAQA